MVADPIICNSLIKSALKEVRSGTDAGQPAREGFQKILSSAVDSINGENIRSGNVNPADVAEIVKLEMLRSSISIGEYGAEPAMTGTGRKIGLLLECAKEYRKNTPHTENCPPGQVGADLNADGQVITDLDGIIKKASERYNVDSGLIKAVIKAESNFNPFAVSSAGAQGLMQLMPSTAQGLGVTNSFDPEQNVMAGTKFLRQMLNRYNGDINSALAAYNWGPGNFEKRGGTMPRETREYLIRVKGYYAQYSA